MSVSKHKVGDMVAITFDPNSVGFVVDIETFEKDDCSYVSFVSGPHTGKKMLYDNDKIISVDQVVSDDQDEQVIIEVVEEKKVEPTTAVEAVSKPVKKKWSKTEIVAMIKEKPGAVDRGILCLQKHESLVPEKSRSYITYWASYIQGGKPLSGKHLFNARRTCFFNAKILVDAANGVI